MSSDPLHSAEVTMTLVDSAGREYDVAATGRDGILSIRLPKGRAALHVRIDDHYRYTNMYIRETVILDVPIENSDCSYGDGKTWK
jgi:hypothetical protein